MSREKMEFDVIIVGGGPAGLAASIRLAQLSQQHNLALNICVLEKGSEIGAHTLSGAVIDPRALNELLPNWQTLQPPTHTPVTQDQFIFLNATRAQTLPTPPGMHNHGNFIISLGEFCRWLANQAEAVGVNIFPGFAATEILYDGERVVGIVTGDKGVDRHGQPTARYQPGMELTAKYTFFAEGCRGSLSQQLIAKYHLRKDKDPQTYGIGIKELWEIPAAQHHAGSVIHTIGWPLDTSTYGGSFVYHFDKNLVEIGFVIGLDYRNPFLNPYEEFQRFKTHPHIQRILANGKRIGYGARCLNEGGYQSIPKLVFPGGLLVGCAAGFVDVPKIKGIHNAMKSAMVAAESIVAELQQSTPAAECQRYPDALATTWVINELYRVRNIRPAMTWGLWPGLAYAALETYIFRGKMPWTFHHVADNTCLKPAAIMPKISYPKHDNVLTFDLTTSLFLANIQYDENQPYHLKLANRQLAIDVNLKDYQAPETRYCPAGVYEILYNDNTVPRLHINGGNCLHCKACDIKDPTQNITWTPSEGGSGPQYERM